jgi:hypothetical protein
MLLAKSGEVDLPSKGKFLVCAAVLVGKEAVARENKYSTSPIMKQISDGEKETLHAEVAVLKHVKDPSARGPLLVIRENALGHLTLAKPCQICHRYIKDNFPRMNVYYSSYGGEIKKLNLSEEKDDAKSYPRNL